METRSVKILQFIHTVKCPLLEVYLFDAAFPKQNLILLLLKVDRRLKYLNNISDLSKTKSISK